MVGSGIKAGRFTTMVRVAHIFTPEHRGWMAYLLLRRVALVACWQLGSSYGGSIPVPGTQGGKIDWRVLPFFVVALSVLAQAWKKPFANALDNVLEQTTLTMLLCVLYADVALTSPSLEWNLGGGTVLTPKLVVLTLAVTFVLTVWVSQRHARKTMQRVHQANFSGIVTDIIAAQQANANQMPTPDGELSSATQASLRRSMAPRKGFAAMIWLAPRATTADDDDVAQSRARSVSPDGVVTREEGKPSVMFDVDPTQANNSGRKYTRTTSTGCAGISLTAAACVVQ